LTSVKEREDTRRVGVARNVVRVAIGNMTAVMMSESMANEAFHEGGTSVLEMKDTRRARLANYEVRVANRTETAVEML